MALSHPPVAWRSHGSGESVAAPPESSGGVSGVEAGCWVGAAELCVSIDDIGFRQSVVAVERLRTYRGRPIAVKQHVIRWRRTVDHLGIAVRVDQAEIAQRIDALITRNHQWCEQAGDFGITLLATPGCVADHAPTEILHLNPLDHAKIQQHRIAGQPLVITDVQQPPAKSWPRDIKVRCRLHYYLADRLAQQIDSRAVGLLIDADGTVTETSVASLAIYHQGRVVSPPPEQVLPGVTQQLVQRVAAELGLSWTHRPLFPADIRQADEVWLMGTDGGLWFASCVDGIAIGDAQPGEIYRRLLAGFDAAVH